MVTDTDVMNEAERIVGLELRRNNRNADGCVTISDIAKPLSMETKQLNSVNKAFVFARACSLCTS